MYGSKYIHQTKSSSAIYSQWRTDLVERIYLVPDRESPGEMLEKQLSPNTINRMLAAVRHMLMEAEEKKLIPTGTFEQFNRVRGVSVKGLKDRLKPNARVRVTPQEMRQLTEQPDASRLLGLRDLALLHTFGNGPRIKVTVNEREAMSSRQAKQAALVPQLIVKTL